LPKSLSGPRAEVKAKGGAVAKIGKARPHAVEVRASITARTLSWRDPGCISHGNRRQNIRHRRRTCGRSPRLNPCAARVAHEDVTPERLAEEAIARHFADIVILDPAECCPGPAA